VTVLVVRKDSKRQQGLGRALSFSPKLSRRSFTHQQKPLLPGQRERGEGVAPVIVHYCCLIAGDGATAADDFPNAKPGVNLRREERGSTHLCV